MRRSTIHEIFGDTRDMYRTTLRLVADEIRNVQAAGEELRTRCSKRIADTGNADSKTVKLVQTIGVEGGTFGVLFVSYHGPPNDELDDLIIDVLADIDDEVHRVVLDNLYKRSMVAIGRPEPEGD